LIIRVIIRLFTWAKPGITVPLATAISTISKTSDQK